MITDKKDLEKFVSENWNRINSYLDEYQADLPVPAYTSVDIRESRFKFAPVDNNLYPAGFNNICLLDINESGLQLKKYIQKIARQHERDIKTVAILPESNTKNLFYLDHLAMLGKCVRDAGYSPIFVTLDQELLQGQSQQEIISHSGYDILIHQASVEDALFVFEQSGQKQKIDLVLLNNDQSTPIQVDWEKIKTLIIPTPKMGWFRRQKTQHFQAYQKVVNDFCQHFNLDTNLLGAKFRNVKDVNYATKEGLATLASEVDLLLKELPKNSKVFVKASQGTYGMGISVVSSGDEILNMNRKTRNKMDIGKNKIKFTSVLIQEGVETILKYDDMPAEVTIYLIGGMPVGGFMRANALKDTNSNLNAKGMVFQKFCISEIRQNKDHQRKEAVYSTIGRLSTIASAIEIKQTL